MKWSAKRNKLLLAAAEFRHYTIGKILNTQEVERIRHMRDVLVTCLPIRPPPFGQEYQFEDHEGGPHGRMLTEQKDRL
ncbi:hypothetical protein JNB91_14235 [Rhizobium wenxiniae]|uniref:hypothetical protein n=1 Tax=Rhizobium wenxiniae TaxID=1737357 RepID=UPI001C6E4E10|nr:hypothetical protein [Rhizobium wenxiniae]MBW9089007.1 hypothetical protein [Rhizobium wenxiniae]